MLAPRIISHLPNSSLRHAAFHPSCPHRSWQFWWVVMHSLHLFVCGQSHSDLNWWVPESSLSQLSHRLQPLQPPRETGFIAYKVLYLNLRYFSNFCILSNLGRGNSRIQVYVLIRGLAKGLRLAIEIGRWTTIPILWKR